jgi:hypothetical protein
MARLPGKAFRTVLRNMTLRLHFDAAAGLMTTRAKAGLDVIPDDANT